MSRYTFPLSVQILLPEDYLRNNETKQQMALIAERGLEGVELNFANPDKLVPAELAEFLAEFGLRMTYFASGFTAKTHGLSLSSTDEQVRARSVAMMRTIIDRISELEGCEGVIVGFFKGGPSADAAPRIEAIRKSLRELAPDAEKTGRAICLEATNRYESCLANSLDDAGALLEGLAPKAFEILPDTFHMNIEESDGEAAFARHLPRFSNVHLSDNNRFLPGFGAIDFERVLRHLRGIGYAGGMALEGNLHGSFAADFRKSTAYLEEAQRRIESGG